MAFQWLQMVLKIRTLKRSVCKQLTDLGRDPEQSRKKGRLNVSDHF